MSEPDPRLSTAPHRSSKDQLVDEVWRRARTSLPAYLVVLAVTWPLLRPSAAQRPIVLWAYGAAFLIGVLRFISTLVVVPRLARISLPVKHLSMLGGAAVAGPSMGGLGFLLYRQLDPLALGLWLTFVAGTCGGATISLGSRPEVFFVYAVPMLIPFVVAPLIWPREGGGVIAAATSVWIVYAFSQVIQYRQTRVELINANTALDAKTRSVHETNLQLVRAQGEAAQRNRELEEKNRELVAMSERADRIFSALAEALPGTTLAGKYKLELRIGSGGFAVVFQAIHLATQRPVAVKVFQPQSGNDTAMALERFRQEAVTNSLLQHPNVVQVLDAGVSEDNIPYIAMELLHGHPFESELRPGEPIAIARVVSAMRQVCLGLAAAHGAGIIHRDVKPENIFIHREHGTETVKLLDFGIAKVTEGTRMPNARVTSTGALVGTPLYMAPERLLGHDSDAEADVYSVGMILYQALAGRLPYEGTVAEVMTQAVMNRPAPLGGLAPHVPTELAAVVMRALAEDPSQRPALTEIVATLDRALPG